MIVIYLGNHKKKEKKNNFILKTSKTYPNMWAIIRFFKNYAVDSSWRKVKKKNSSNFECEEL